MSLLNAAATLPIGGTYFVSQSIVLKNIDGVISTISDTVVESNRDSGLAAPTVSIIAGITGVPSADLVTNWSGSAGVG